MDTSGGVAIPRGSKAQLVIVSAPKGGNIPGAPDLVVSLGPVSVGGRRYELETADVQQRGKLGLVANKRTASAFQILTYPKEPESVPSWAAEVGRDGGNEKHGSTRGGWLYNR